MTDPRAPSDAVAAADNAAVAADSAAAGPAAVVSAAGPSPASFEAALAELEMLVQRMEGGELSLEESLGAYRRGAQLVSFCRKSLADVQQQVRILEADLLRPFQDGEEDAS